jgi:hypothetical protein
MSSVILLYLTIKKIVPKGNVFTEYSKTFVVLFPDQQGTMVNVYLWRSNIYKLLLLLAICHRER